jgi:hypothetical protein
MPEFLREASQPGICVLHFGFKLAAFFCYMFMNFAIKNLIMTYIVVLILVIVDFWVVKNVTGRYPLLRVIDCRKLVGLRWESFIKEDGTEEWIYFSDDRCNTALTNNL